MGAYRLLDAGGRRWSRYQSSSPSCRRRTAGLDAEVERERPAAVVAVTRRSGWPGTVTRSKAATSRGRSGPDKPPRRTDRTGTARRQLPRGTGDGRTSGGTVGPAAGNASPGRKLSASCRAHAETCCAASQASTSGSGRGPIVNPFPLDKSGQGRDRAHAHRDPRRATRRRRADRYRPRQPGRVPRRFPDRRLDQIFARLKSRRDRALLSVQVIHQRPGRRAARPLQDDVRPSDQLISLTNKDSRASGI